jgi:hypothetical protein
MTIDEILNENNTINVEKARKFLDKILNIE